MPVTDTRLHAANGPCASSQPGDAARPAALSWHVYIVCCADRTLYTGIAVDPGARVAAHNAGRGARYTRARRPVELVYREAAANRGQALRREYQIKRFSRARKLRLIAGAERESGGRGQGTPRHRRLQPA